MATPEPASVIAARQLAEEARSRGTAARRRRPPPLRPVEALPALAAAP
ncbi:hypothetical protein O2V63_07495 [Modestobacter sp. VKM Ac-2977]|nr:hypothetical protein [Modestobacter sp. VKM Ac-2977]MCZ2820167.1 hypothetical protein [Modestobacter sp. VKM Ac-2977]